MKRLGWHSAFYVGAANVGDRGIVYALRVHGGGSRLQHGHGKSGKGRGISDPFTHSLGTVHAIPLSFAR